MEAKNPYKTYISMLKKIEDDNLEAIRTKLTSELATSPQWPDIRQQLFYKAVIHSSHMIIIFMLKEHPMVLNDDTVFNLQILRHAVRNENLQLVKVILNSDLKLMISAADFDMYDCIIQEAFRCYYQKGGSPLDEKLFRAKMIVKFLIEYPKHQSHQFGIRLFLDETTMEIDLTISEDDINKLYDQKTVLEIYAERIKVMDRKLVYLMQLFKNIVYCLVREVVRLKICKLVLSSTNERVISSSKDLKRFAKNCLDEMIAMVGYSIIDHHFKVSVKVSSLIADTLVKYSCTEKIVKVVLSREFRNKFPVYWSSIRRFITAAVNQRNKLLKDAGPPF